MDIMDIFVIFLIVSLILSFIYTTYFDKINKWLKKHYKKVIVTGVGLLTVSSGLLLIPESPPGGETDDEIEEPFIYFNAPDNTFGVTSGKLINYTYFWNLFNKHSDWQLEAWNPQLNDWVDEYNGENLNNWLEITKTKINSDNAEKIALNVTNNAPIDTYFRFKFGIDLRVKQYVNKTSNFEYEITYPASDTENYTVFFNWSDLIPDIQAGKISVDHGVKNIGGKDVFWFIIRGLKKLSPGSSYLVDPTFGYTSTDGFAKTPSSYCHLIIGSRATCSNSGLATSISLYGYEGTSGADIQCALYDIDDSYKFLGATPTYDSPFTTYATWETMEFDTPIAVSSGNEYYILAWIDCDPGNLWYWQKSGSSNEYYESDSDCFNWPDPCLSPDSSSYSKAIYCTISENSEPTYSNPSPNGTFVDSVATLNLTISDGDTDNMNLSWYGDGVYLGTNSTVGDGTYEHDWTLSDSGYHEWYAKVADDAANVTTDTYIFVNQYWNDTFNDDVNESSSSNISISDGMLNYTVDTITTSNDIYQVLAGDYDAHESFNGAFDGTQDYIRADDSTSQASQYVGEVIYQDVQVPNGATILDADLKIYVYNSGSYDDPNCLLYAEDEDNCNDFTTEADILGRTKTTEFQVYRANNIGYNGWHYMASEFDDQVQEVVNRPGWSSGNNLGLIVEGENENLGNLIFYSYEYGTDGTRDANLYLNYTYGSSTDDGYWLSDNITKLSGKDWDKVYYDANRSDGFQVDIVDWNDYVISSDVLNGADISSISNETIRINISFDGTSNVEFYSYNISIKEPSAPAGVSKKHLGIRNDGVDYFVWLGEGSTNALNVSQQIDGMDEAEEYIGKWCNGTWADDNATWQHFHPDNETGTNFNVETFDIIKVYLTDSGTQNIDMYENTSVTYTDSRTITLWNDSINKGYNYTAFNSDTPSTLGAINTSIGLEAGEAVGVWDNSTYVWKWCIAFFDLNTAEAVSQWDVVVTKVEDTETWNT